MTVEWHGEEAKLIVSKASHEALWEMAEKILMESKNLAPKDTGTLRRSSTTSWGKKPSPSMAFRTAKSGGTPEKAKKGETKAKYLYITYNTPYALYVHEGVKRAKGKGKSAVYSGSLKFTNGGAKFLEKAYKKYAVLIPKFVQMRVKQALAKKV